MYSIGPNDIESIEKKTLTFHAGYSCLAAWLYALSYCIYCILLNIYTKFFSKKIENMILDNESLSVY